MLNHYYYYAIMSSSSFSAHCHMSAFVDLCGVNIHTLKVTLHHLLINIFRVSERYVEISLCTNIHNHRRRIHRVIHLSFVREVWMCFIWYQVSEKELFYFFLFLSIQFMWELVLGRLRNVRDGCCFYYNLMLLKFLFQSSSIQMRAFCSKKGKNRSIRVFQKMYLSLST